MAKAPLKNMIIFAILVAGTTPAAAGSLTYQPRNPSFGGNPLYSQHLLGVAEAINKFQDPATTANLPKTTSPSQQFEQVVQSALLSQISSQIANQIYGETARDNGTFQIGSTKIDFAKQGGQTVVNLSDLTSGGATTISIPTPTP